MSKAGSAIGIIQGQTVEGGSVQHDRLFYMIAASTMLILTAVGFRAFILHGKGAGGEEITRQIVPLVVVHGLAMLGWVVFFFIQSTLIIAGNRRLHMVIGPIGGVIAAAIVILGSVAASLSVHFNPELYKPFGGARFFLMEMYAEMLLFAAFASIGFAYRRRPEIHRPMMLLTLVCIGNGSLGRCPYIGDLTLIPPLYSYSVTFLFGALLFVVQCAMTRTVNRSYAIGYAGIVLASLVAIVIGKSGPWNQLVAGFVP